MGSLFRRYRTWNPVHPTAGAFWGIGVGLGCGVGWGFGFGPEAVGFVGSGCGVGFSIGVTFIGVGVGLPTSEGLIRLPLNSLVFTAKGAANTTSTVVFPAVALAAQQCWQALSAGVAEVKSVSKSVEGAPSSKDLMGQEGKDLPETPPKSNHSGVPPPPKEQNGSFAPPPKAAILPSWPGNFGLRPRGLVVDAKKRR